MRQPIALILLVMSLAACARENPAAPASSAASPSPTLAPATAASATPAPAHAPGDLTAAAVTQQERVDTVAAADTGSSSLERIAALPSEGQLPGGKWVAGTNYKVIAPAQPTDASPGKVEVIEMFWYGCPHCFALDPIIESWRKNKAPYIEFVRVPVMWGEAHRAHARMFYTLQALGKLEQLHAAVFNEIQNTGDSLYVPGDEQGTQRVQVQFARTHGVDPTEFLKAYSSFGVQTNLEKADELERRYKIDAVPTIVIDGKYETDVGQAGGQENLMQLINDLSASEKRH
jgi:protein dithiol oxidoreductase (disulfide-forming)